MRPITVVTVAAGIVMLAGCRPAAGPTPAAPSPSVSGSATPSSSSEPASARPRPSITGPDAPILAGTHRFTIKPAQAGESALTIDATGRLTAGTGQSDGALLVLEAEGARYRIKTATGEGACLNLEDTGKLPLTIATAACVPGRDTQLFTIGRPPSGDPATYVISVKDAYLEVSQTDGLIAVQPGNAAPITAFVLVDYGSAR